MDNESASDRGSSRSGQRDLGRKSVEDMARKSAHRSPSREYDDDGEEEGDVLFDEDGETGLRQGGLDDTSLASGKYLARLTGVACLGGLQFGWDTGIASGMLVAIRSDLGHELSEGEQEVIVSSTTVGAILGSILAGRLSDRFGRKKVMILSGILFLLGSLEQSASQVVRELVLGRTLVGLGVGMSSMVVPTYLAEVAPSKVRGRLVGMNSLLVTGGQVIAYLIDAAFYNLPHGWRWMVLVGAVPAILQLVAMIYLDESPRWLIGRRKFAKARKTLQKIYPNADTNQINDEVDRISLAVLGHQQQQQRGNEQRQHDLEDGSRTHRGAEEPSSGLRHIPGSAAAVETASALTDLAVTKTLSVKSKLDLLWTEPTNRRALILSCGLQFFQQAIGFNALMYFSGRLLLMVGFVNNPNAAAIGIAAANFAGTVVALKFLDRWGRRKLLLRTIIGMTISLALLSTTLSLVDLSSTRQLQHQDQPHDQQQQSGTILASTASLSSISDSTLPATVATSAVMAGGGATGSISDRSAASLAPLISRGPPIEVESRVLTMTYRHLDSQRPSAAGLRHRRGVGRDDSPGSESESKSERKAKGNMVWSYLSLVFMIIFTLNYALGMGIVPWLVQSEVFSDDVRSVGAGLSSATNWMSNLLISSTFLHLVKWITPQGSFGVYTVVSALAFWFTYTHLPEFNGISLNHVKTSWLPGANPTNTVERNGYQSLNTTDDVDHHDHDNGQNEDGVQNRS